MTQPHPSSPSFSPASSLFFIGRNSHGQWVVRDSSGHHGGLFIDRVQAIRFAMFENGHQPQAVVMVPGTLELDLTDHTPSPHGHAQQRS